MESSSEVLEGKMSLLNWTGAIEELGEWEGDEVSPVPQGGVGWGVLTAKVQQTVIKKKNLWDTVFGTQQGGQVKPDGKFMFKIKNSSQCSLRSSRPSHEGNS